MDTILFVCTGNTCRSPTAESIAQDWLDRTRPDRQGRHLAVSAGIAAVAGMPAAAEAVKALADLGITHAGRSKPLTVEMVRRASVVLCMTEGHLAAVRDLVRDTPEHASKVLLLDPDGDIEDPLGTGQAAYDALATRFADLIPRRLKEVLAHEDRTGVGPPGP